METQLIKQNPDPEDDSTRQLLTGTILVNRYLIESVSGVGGMGAVYRARDMHFPNVTKLVAVKEMVNRALNISLRNTIVRNFEREANLLASLDHPAIPKIYDYFTISERSYLVMEYIAGQDLERIITNHPDFLPETRVIRWAIELCDVLSYLHNHLPEPIIFRDMKPSNVMINQHDHAILIDFGIAKQFESAKKGTMIGTEGYSPPEQYRGEATPIADIYSLGATLHHVLTKQDPRLEPPFSFSERPIRQINIHVSARMDDIITKMLQYDPADRYENIAELKESLLAAGKETGVLTKFTLPTPIIQQTTEAIRPVWQYKCSDEIRGNPTYHNGYVYFGCYDNQLYALDAYNGELAWKYQADGGIVSKPALYEELLYFGSEDKRIHALVERTGRINWTYYTKGPVRSSPVIAEGHIFIGSDDGYLHVVNAITGRQAWCADGGAPVRSTPAIWNDRVYFGTEAGDFFCMNYSGEVVWRFKARRAITSSPVITQGIIYISSVDSTLYALDAKTGWVIWRYRLGKPSISTPYIHDDQLYVGAIDGIIYCLEASSAREIWRYVTQNQVTGSPIVHNTSLLCGSIDDHLYSLDTRTGKLQWKFETNGPITSTPEIAENLIYFGSTDKNFYALSI